MCVHVSACVCVRVRVRVCACIKVELIIKIPHGCTDQDFQLFAVICASVKQLEQAHPTFRGRMCNLQITHESPVCHEIGKQMCMSDHKLVRLMTRNKKLNALH